jgi:hypothetical protein
MERGLADFGLEPFETGDGVYYGATLALAVGSAPGYLTSPAADTKLGLRLRGYLKEKAAAQSLQSGLAAAGLNAIE